MLNQIISSNHDFDSFIKKSKEVLSNIKKYNETVKKSEFNIEILTAKTNLQNRLNELTLKKEFGTEEREKLKTQLSEISNIEATLNEKDPIEITPVNDPLKTIKPKLDQNSTINSSNNSDKFNILAEDSKNNKNRS